MNIKYLFIKFNTLLFTFSSILKINGCCCNGKRKVSTITGKKNNQVNADLEKIDLGDLDETITINNKSNPLNTSIDPNINNNKVKSYYDNYDDSKDPSEDDTDVSDVAIHFNKEDDFYFNLTEENKKKALKVTGELIKKLIKKKGIIGTFNIEKVKLEHEGKNDVKEAKVICQDENTFNIFIKKDDTTQKEETLCMLKGFDKVGLLPFKYCYDKEEGIIVTEDVNEKGFEFLDFDFETALTEKNKRIWNKCLNINEFRFWCYILMSDDIDPKYKYDNCVFKNNKVYALDLRYSQFIEKQDENDYVELFKRIFESINTNDISEANKTSNQYKVWKNSIDSFKDFTNQEKTSINKKLPELVVYLSSLHKNDKFKNMSDFKKYIKSVLERIFYFFKDYIVKYSNKYPDDKLQIPKNEGLQLYVNSIRYSRGKPNSTYSYEELNSNFSKFIKNSIDFKSILTKDTVCNLFDCFCHLVELSIFGNEEIKNYIGEILPD